MQRRVVRLDAGWILIFCRESYICKRLFHRAAERSPARLPLHMRASGRHVIVHERDRENEEEEEIVLGVEGAGVVSGVGGGWMGGT